MVKWYLISVVPADRAGTFSSTSRAILSHNHVVLVKVEKEDLFLHVLHFLISFQIFTMTDVYNNPETVDAIKIMVLGCLLAEYGSRLMVDDTKQNLKYRVKCVLNAVKNVELHFINHNNTNEEHRQAFKRAFNKNETVALTELILMCWEINEDGIDEIIKAVRASLIPVEEINNQ
jgi:hypothetical protein